VVDAWNAIHPPTEMDIQFMSDQAQIDVLGVTCDSRLNTFRPTHLETATDDPNAKRIDYIFTSEPVIEEAKVAFTDRIPIHNVNYSDHFGVSVTLLLPDFQNRKRTGYLPPKFSVVSEKLLHPTLFERKNILFCEFVISCSLLSFVYQC